MKKTKILVALLLALVLCFTFGLAACQPECEHEDANNDHNCDKCGAKVSEHVDANGDDVCDICGGQMHQCADADNNHKCDTCGAILSGHSDADGDGFCDVCDTNVEIFEATSAGYDDEKVYTAHSAITGLSTLNWNPLTWEESTDSSVLGYVSTGFFDFVLNKDGNGYVIVPEMAAYVPGTHKLYEDVTSQYVGSFGVEEGETSKAFRIYLNADAKWDDGTPITAEDYIYSLKQQLDPFMMNRRADSFYGGDFSIYGAENYLYSTTESVFKTLKALGYSSIAEAKTAGVNIMWDVQNALYQFCGTTGSEVFVDAQGNECPEYISVTDETVYNTAEGWSAGTTDDEFTSKDIYDMLDGAGYIAYYYEVGAGYESYGIVLGNVEINDNFGYEWDGVGFLAGKDAEGHEYLDMIIENSLVNPEFYVPYYQSSATLVKQDVYESSLVYHYEDGTTSTGSKEEGKEVTSITSIYNSGTDSKYWVSYGPYVVASHQLDKELRFERNTNWYGYSDCNHYGQYQIDSVVWTVVESYETQLLMFEKGEIDDYTLQAADVEKYGSSSQILYSPDSYTRKLSFLVDYDALEARETEGINKTMLTVKDFRQALSLVINRDEYARACTASNNAGYGMFNTMYIIDINSGVPYRATDAGKKVIVDLYGIEYGEGKTYATLDEAYQAVTGYDQAKAIQLFDSAYDYATTHDKLGNVVEAGSADAIYNGTDVVEIQFGKYSDNETWNLYYNNLKTAFEEGAKGSKFEGKISFTSYTSSTYTDAFQDGEIDAIFTTWGGAILNCLSTFSQCYCDDYTGGGNQYERGFNTDTYDLTIALDLDGSGNKVEFTSTLKNWSDWLAGSKEAKAIKSADGTVTLGKYQDYDFDTLTEIFAGIEYRFLSEYVFTPLFYYYYSSLDSYRVKEAVTEYVSLVGFGGIRFTTYNYDDTEWTAYVASQGGTLDYTK